jgi:hypothetical protein
MSDGGPAGPGPVGLAARVGSRSPDPVRSDSVDSRPAAGGEISLGPSLDVPSP